MCPVTLEMSRSGDHEYYAALPQKAKTDGAAETSLVRRGGVYYFAAWNAFSLEFTDENIAPYQVFVIGQAEEILSEVLKQAGNKLKATIEE